MFGYVKTIRLVILEFLICMAFHVLYAFYKFGVETGIKTFIAAMIFSMMSVLVSLVIKKEKIVVFIELILMILATEFLGIYDKTLAFSALIYLAISASLTIFMEKEYIIYSYVVSVVSFFINFFFSRKYIVTNTGSSLMYFVYLVVYTVSVVNLYIIVHYAKTYMKGMEEQALEAQRANESKMMFLANISHEIRTPMNAICGMTELASRENNSPEVEEYINGIQSSGKVLLSIVNDILDYSKLESGNLEVIPVTYSLDALLADMINMMEIRLADKQVTLTYKIDERVPKLLYGDEIRLRQILFNLISNAIKFTDHGYISINVSGAEEGNKYRLFVSVTDSGIGIKKEDYEKIFISFQQVDSRKFRNKEGSGLGLAICKDLTALMGGSIHVESTYGVGSKFSFDILQEKTNENESLVENVVTKPSSPVVKEENKVVIENSKVLVVDDNKVNLKVAQGLLRTFGLTVDICLSGRECIEILRNDKSYDMVFLDHMMPELDGIDTLRIIRSTGDDYMKSIPIIALTANVMDGVREMFMEEGFDDYVAKPIDMSWMNSILRKFIPVEKQR